MGISASNLRSDNGGRGWTVSSTNKPNKVNVGCTILYRDGFTSKYTGELKYKWRPAEVRRIEGTSVLLHFVGWSDIHDKVADLVQDEPYFAPLDILDDSEREKGAPLSTTQLSVTHKFLQGGNQMVDSHSNKPLRKASYYHLVDANQACRVDLLNECLVGQKVDVQDLYRSKSKDIVAKWRPAEIIETTGSSLIKVHFIGWDSKWDTVIDLSKSYDRVRRSSCTLRTPSKGVSIKTDERVKPSPSAAAFRRFSSASVMTSTGGISGAAGQSVDSVNDAAVLLKPTVSVPVVSRRHSFAVLDPRRGSGSGTMNKRRKSSSSVVPVDLSAPGTAAGEEKIVGFQETMTTEIGAAECSVDGHEDINHRAHSSRSEPGIITNLISKLEAARICLETSASHSGTLSHGSLEVVADPVCNGGDDKATADVNNGRNDGNINTEGNDDGDDDRIQAAIAIAKQRLNIDSAAPNSNENVTQKQKVIETQAGHQRKRSVSFRDTVNDDSHLLAAAADRRTYLRHSYPLPSGTPPTGAVRRALIRRPSLSEEKFIQVLDHDGMHVVDVQPDGNSLFRAVIYQIHGVEIGHQELRQQCVDHMQKHKERFSLFCSSNIDEHLKCMREEQTQGEDLEIRALEELVDRIFVVYSCESLNRDMTPIPMHVNVDEYSLMVGVAPIRLACQQGSSSSSSSGGYEYKYSAVLDEKQQFPLGERSTRVLEKERVRLYMAMMEKENCDCAADGQSDKD